MTHKYVIVTPNPALAAVVGKHRLLETEVSERVSVYIDEHNLQDDDDDSMIHADANLLKIIGVPTCTASELDSLLDAYLRRNTAMLAKADVLTANTAQVVAPTKGRKQIEKRLDDLQMDLKRVLSKYEDYSFAREFIREIPVVMRALPCWQIRTMTVSTAAANRACNMLAGPSFSCKEFPWPKDRGTPVVPVAQIDLRVASRLRGGLSLGDGLLQVFWGRSSCEFRIRVIPRAVVESARLTPIPVLRQSLGCFPPLDWTKKDGVFDEIVGFSDPMISSTAHFELDGQWRRIPRELRTLVEQTNAIQGNDVGFHMFGTFHSIQYGPDEKPPCLMSIDSERGYIWGDLGSAQAFYQIDERGRVAFSCDWACG